MIFFLIGYFCGIGYFTTAKWSMGIDLVVWTLLFWGASLVLIATGHKMEESEKGLSLLTNLWVGMTGGCSLFMFCWFFFGWNQVIWWYFLFLFLGWILHFIPGGYTLCLFRLQKMGWIAPVLPSWARVLVITMDVISLIAIIVAVVSWRTSANKKNKLNRYYSKR